MTDSKCTVDVICMLHMALGSTLHVQVFLYRMLCIFLQFIVLSYSVSQKHANFGNLYLQVAWIKHVQFCCKISQQLIKLYPCLIFMRPLMLSCFMFLTLHHAVIQRRHRFHQCVQCVDMSLPTHLSTVPYFLNFSSNLLMLFFVQLLSRNSVTNCREYILLFIQTFN